MAVLRSKRTLAYSEFERQMAKIHKDLSERMHALPARYKKHVCKKLYEPMNRAYDALILSDEQKGHSKTADEKRQKCFSVAIRNLLAMEKPLMAFENIREVKDTSCQMIGRELNFEISLIWGAAGWPKEEMPVFHSLKKEKFSRLAFLGKMAELHRYTFEKTAHAPNDCFDSLSCRIDDFATNALYDVVMANDRMPTTKAEADKRDAYLKDALDNLNAMQRPMVGLWNIMQYSENIMDEWAGMLDEEIAILNGLRNKDRERYKGLK